MFQLSRVSVAPKSAFFDSAIRPGHPKPSIPQQKLFVLLSYSRDSPRTRSMVIAAVQWAKRIMGKIDEECGK
jgi:hypothetical protein